MINRGPTETVNHDSLKAYQQLANRLLVNDDYVVSPPNDFILVDSTDAAVDITLPLARNGQVFTIIRVAGANSVTVLPTGTDTVNGTTSVVISASYTPYTFKDFTPLLTGYAQIG